ncbi:BMC domain-containing protein [Lacrimispora aerotolerans]|uniref:BMC domain-containing protein n=1 Tax=Lacrimispora aerotolerans TaxID=36832 RepID=UPI00047A957D|nr:BMC domain-containing protein [Lacrimispora aerotolerans]
MSDKIETELDVLSVFARGNESASTGRRRVVNMTVAGREISLAHVIGVSEASVYKNLGLDIGTNADVDFTGMSIGTINITPPESAVIGADIGVKSADVTIGFLDRFSGTLILTGPRIEVRTAVEEIVTYFKEELKYKTCPVTER